MKRILIIGGILALVGLLLVMFRPHPTSPPPSPSQTATTSTLPSVEDIALTKNGLCYLTAEIAPTLQCLNENETTTPIPVDSPHGLVRFAPDGLHAAIQIPGKDRLSSWTIIALTTGKTVGTISGAARDLAFAPNGKRVMYHYVGDGVSNLSTAAIDGNDWKAVLPVPEALGTLVWLSPETVAMYTDLGEVPNYQAVFLSSQRREVVGTGDEPPKAALSGGFLALGNREFANVSAPTTTIHSIESDVVSAPRITIPTSITLTGWDSAKPTLYSLETAEDEWQLVEYDLAANSRRAILETGADLELGATDVTPITQVLGVHRGILYVTTGTQLRQFELPK